VCGIFCAVSLEEEFSPDLFDRFVELTDLVRYRGPDDSGYTALNTRTGSLSRGQRFNLFLGSRRLSIFDLSSAGHQPMTDGKGRWIVFNGEIFNYLELRQELKNLGHQFTTGTDTEVILHVYDEYGEEGFERLNGMWAFALVDLPAHRVVVSRDRFSIKPLYVHVAGRTFYFASEIKQLLPLLPSRELDRETMSTFLQQGLLDHARQTFFREIERVPPRTNLVFDLRKRTLTECIYWHYGKTQAIPSSQVLETFRELFWDSVRIRLRSDVKVGILLSGGVDSSAIATVTSLLCPGGLLSYSIISDDPRLSEERFIDLLSQKVKFPSSKHIFDGDDAVNKLDATLEHNDEPFASFSVVAQYAIFQAIKRDTDLTVLLSGQGGDEVLLGYLKFFFFYLKDLASHRRILRVLGELLRSMAQGTIIPQVRFSTAKRYMSSWNRWQKHKFLLDQVAPVPVWHFTDMTDRQMADIESFSVPALTHYEDRNSMAHSLEVRHPFLDHRLVDFTLQLPAEWKIRGGWTKYVLRKSLHELPSPIRWRKDKLGFVVPEETWLRGKLRQQVQENLQDGILAEMGVIDEREFLRYYDRFLEGRVSIDPYEISRVFIAEMWAKKFFGRSSAAAESGLNSDYERACQTPAQRA
jgi:asparagine synthase (glutamine-hydrolysing)